MGEGEDGKGRRSVCSAFFFPDSRRLIPALPKFCSLYHPFHAFFPPSGFSTIKKASAEERVPLLMLSLMVVQKNGERINDLKKYENDLNFKGIDFPVKVKDIQKFENNNPDLPGINVFSVNDNNKIYPLRHNQKDCQKSIDLFLYSEDEKQHYSLIKNFTRLVRSQYTSHRSS